MIKLDSSGHARSFIVPLLGSRDAQRAAIRDHLMGLGVKPEPVAEPVEAVAPSRGDDFEAVLAELRTTLGSDFDRVLPADEIAALRADPTARARFTKSLSTSRALARRDDARAEVAAAKVAVVDDERERSRLAGLARKVGEAERAARQTDFG